MELYALKEGAIANLTAREPRRDGQWEADVFASPVPLRTKTGVCFPPVVLIVETGSGFILCAKVIESGACEVQILGDALIEAMRQHCQVPAVVAVRPGFDEAFSPLSAMLAMRIEVHNNMGTLAMAWRSLLAAMKKDLPGGA